MHVSYKGWPQCGHHTQLGSPEQQILLVLWLADDVHLLMKLLLLGSFFAQPPSLQWVTITGDQDMYSTQSFHDQSAVMQAMPLPRPRQQAHTLQLPPPPMPLPPPQPQGPLHLGATQPSMS